MRTHVDSMKEKNGEWMRQERGKDRDRSMHEDEAQTHTAQTEGVVYCVGLPAEAATVKMLGCEVHGPELLFRHLTDEKKRRARVHE